ncbi:MAG TPA: hypothetical protein VGK59_05510 [Ohtaekwangia sp.]
MKEVFTHMLIPRKSVGFPPWLDGIRLFQFASFPVHTQERVASDTVKDENGQLLAETGVLKSTSSRITTAADERHFTCL